MFVEPRGMLKERDIELSSNDGGHRREVAAPVAEAFQTFGDGTPDPLREWQGLGGLGTGAFLDRSDGLHDYERVALAGAPDLLIQPGGNDRRVGHFGQRLYERRGVRSDERREQEMEEMGLAAQLVDDLAENRRARQLLISH